MFVTIYERQRRENKIDGIELVAQSCQGCDSLALRQALTRTSR